VWLLRLLEGAIPLPSVVASVCLGGVECRPMSVFGDCGVSGGAFRMPCLRVFVWSAVRAKCLHCRCRWLLRWLYRLASLAGAGRLGSMFGLQSFLARE
jgi:hypothetical protein